MAITRAPGHPPPLLPPSVFLPDIAAGRDPGWQWGNDSDASPFSRPATAKSGSSLPVGRSTAKFRHQKESDSLFYMKPDYASHASFTAPPIGRNMPDPARLTRSDEGKSLARLPSNQRLHGEKQLEQRTLEASSNTYDKQLLSRIGGPNAVPNPSRRTSIAYGIPDTLHTVPPDPARRRSSQLKPLLVPEQCPRSHEQQQKQQQPNERQQEQHQTWLDSLVSSRWPCSGAVSPRFTGFSSWAEHATTLPGNSRTVQAHQYPPATMPATSTTTTTMTTTSIASMDTAYANVTRHGSITFDSSVSQRPSYDHAMLTHDHLVEDGQMGHLNLHDRSPASSDDFRLGARAGTKRRASSPPREHQSREERSSVSSASGQTDIYHRRSLQALPRRSSPVSRSHPCHLSLSSISSYGLRQNSLASSLGIASNPSSATSYASSCLSPNPPSPAFEPDVRMHGTRSFNSSGGTALSRPHQRTMSESTHGGAPIPLTDSVTHSRNGSTAHFHGVYICECCPKKPKKFDSEEDLRLHASEKQYTCAYCPNRFKNKNEAERHQNSLHLRRHSWSCAALAGVEAAFHSSTAGNNSDVCGYCGEEFPNPPQWNVRAEHLNHVHKFGECNQAKKFFRADHFRQHLKHSHAGTSGKWTNMLEIACMKDEPLPEKRVVSPVMVAAPGSSHTSLLGLAV